MQCVEVFKSPVKIHIYMYIIFFLTVELKFILLIIIIIFNYVLKFFWYLFFISGTFLLSDILKTFGLHHDTTSDTKPISISRKQSIEESKGSDSDGTVRYFCNACDRSYLLYNSLYNHKKFECGKQPLFKCPFCEHMTKQKGNLKTHVKKIHPVEYLKEPWVTIVQQ